MIRRIRAKLNREIGKRMFKKRAVFPADRKVASFSFDDFPLSAITSGARILEEEGIRGTYYAALGMFDQEGFPAKNAINGLLDRGHEVGCHTFSHIHCGLTPAIAVEADCLKNVQALTELTGRKVTVFAYPYGEFSPASKKRVSSNYNTARMVTPGINRNTVDMAALYAVPVDMQGGINRVRRWVDDLAQHGGWAIFYTHGVLDNPTEYDSTEQLLIETVRLCKEAGFEFMTVGEASELCEMT